MKGKKSGGRMKGTPNKVTNDTREKIKDILTIELENLHSYISAIERPEIKAKLILDLLPYVTPKYQSVNIGLENDSESEKFNFPPFMQFKVL